MLFTSSSNQPNQTIGQAFETLKKERDIFRKTNTANITTVGLSTKNTIRSILSRAKEGQPIQAYVTLCPIYNGNGGITGDFGDISTIPPRFQGKFNAAKSTVDFLKQLLPLQVTYILADQGVVVGPEYDQSSFGTTIENIRRVYQTGIQSDSLATFSEIGLSMPSTEVNEGQFTRKDVESYLKSQEITTLTQFQLDIIERAFGATALYFFLKNYLAESREVASKFKDCLFINTEACEPLNSIYQAGKLGERLIDTNALVSVTARI